MLKRYLNDDQTEYKTTLNEGQMMTKNDDQTELKRESNKLEMNLKRTYNDALTNL